MEVFILPRKIRHGVMRFVHMEHYQRQYLAAKYKGLCKAICGGI
jgi:hypothetical protein